MSNHFMAEDESVRFDKLSMSHKRKAGCHLKHAWAVGLLPKPDEQTVKLRSSKLWKSIALMASSWKTRHTFSLKWKGRRRLKSWSQCRRAPFPQRRRTILAVLNWRVVPASPCCTLKRKCRAGPQASLGRSGAA